MLPGIPVWLELAAGNTQKANALSASHCPSNSEGNACKCQRLRHIAPTRPSVKCQRCVVGLNSGFSDGRGSHVRTAVDILIQHHVQVSFETSFVSDATLLAYLEFRRFARVSICMASRTEHFGSGLSGPKLEAHPRAACFTGHSQVQNPGICSHSVVVPKEARPIHTEETHKIPNDDIAGTSGRFRELRLAHKMHGGLLTEWGDYHLVDPRFLPVHHRTADVLARFCCSLGCFGDVDRHCCFG